MAMTIVETRAVTGGVDTHLDVHVAAALDDIGGLLGVGYQLLLAWLGTFGMVERVGIEGTGSSGLSPGVAGCCAISWVGLWVDGPDGTAPSTARSDGIAAVRRAISSAS